MEGSLRQIPLSELGDTIGIPPSQRLKDSVKRMGIIQPVILTEQSDESGEIHLAIVDGNRRVAAARSAGMDQIPAVVFEGLEPTTIAETFRRTGKLTRRDVQAFTSPDSKAQQTGDKVADQLATAAADAAKAGYSKAEFVEMAGRIWDTSVGESATQSDEDHDKQVMTDHAPVDPFPELAAHKWDTGES